MRFSFSAAAAGLLLVSSPCFASIRHRSSTHATVRHTSVRGHHAVTRAAVTRRAEPMGMDTERATQIQTELIKRGYLTGEPTGRWDSDSVAAMQKLQGDNGWQTKITPDSRAIIKLGLGPQPKDQ